MAHSPLMLVVLAALPLLWVAAEEGPLLPEGSGGDALDRDDELERDPLYDEELWRGP